jgi:hypothetical protein
LTHRIVIALGRLKDSRTGADMLTASDRSEAEFAVHRHGGF